MPDEEPGNPMPNSPPEASRFCRFCMPATAAAEELLADAGDWDAGGTLFLLGEPIPGLAMMGGACNCWTKELDEEVGKDALDELEVLFNPLSLSRTVLRLFFGAAWPMGCFGAELRTGLRSEDVGFGAILGMVPAI